MYNYKWRRSDCKECGVGYAVDVSAVACALQRVSVLVKNAPKSHGAKSGVATCVVSPKLSNF